MKYSIKPIAFRPEWVEILGDIETAIYFQQIWYWSDKGTRKDGYIYKTIEEFEYETTLSRYKQERARKKLLQIGLIETMLKKANGAPTLHFKMTDTANGFVRNSQIHLRETDKSLTESTTEIPPKAPQGGRSLNRRGDNHKEKENTSSCESPLKSRASKMRASDIERMKEVITASDYKPDGFSPKQRVSMKRKMERAIGLKKSTKWSDLLFGSAWDFMKAYRFYKGEEYVGDVVVGKTAKVLARWYEAGEDRESVREIITAYFEGKKGDKIPATPTSVFSDHTYNSWKQNML